MVVARRDTTNQRSVVAHRDTTIQRSVVAHRDATNLHPFPKIELFF